MTEKTQVTYVYTKDGTQVLLVWMPELGFTFITHDCKCVEHLSNMFTKEAIKAYIQTLEEDYYLEMIEDKKEVLTLIRGMI